MADNKIEKSIVTTEAFQNFINTFKKYIYNWDDPSCNGNDNTKNSVDEKQKDDNGVEGIVAATNKDIEDLFN